MTLASDSRTPLVRRDPPGAGSKAARALWGLVWIVLYRPSPRPLHGWRAMLLRLFGATVGKGAKPYPSARVWAPWNLEMGPGSVMGDDVDCYAVDRVVLEAGAVVSQRSYLCTASRDINDPGLPLMTGPIVVRARGWVAAEVYVGPGVTIGEGAVAAARSVVIRDVAPWTVVAGNPARAISQRKKTAL